MCGFAGMVGDIAVDAPTAAAVLAALEHRGPDGSGTHTADGVWLGFQRLAILDLERRADQPMVDHETGVAIAFNGEIYNYVELRSRLAARGHRFVTDGDTEVLLHSYLEWGEACLDYLDGMFAIAIADPRLDQVLLARDRFGEKPLYYGRDGQGRWWFGSEPGALRRAGVGSCRADLRRIAGFLTLGDIEDPAGSYFDGISQLPPGTTAVLHRTGLDAPRRWWSIATLLDDEWERPAADREEVIDAIDASVRRRLRSDVVVGTSLSGGVDSSTIVASMRAVDPAREIHTFTASFPGEPIDEWRRAVAVGRRHGATMHRVEPTVDDFVAGLDDVVMRQGAPIESPTVFAQWSVMRAASETGVTVLLDGQGADETWGGYPKYVWSAIGALMGERHLRRASAVHAQWRRGGNLPRPAFTQLGGLALPPALRPAALSMAGGRHRSSLGVALVDVRLDDPQGDPGVGGLLRKAARADIDRVLLPRLLRYADRNSMAWGREMRLPFLDERVVRLGLRSWSEGLSTGWTKWHLRRAVEHRLPDDIVWNRTKLAYQTPDAAWLADARVTAMVCDARADLVERSLISADHAQSIDPWRALTLSRFLDLHGLST